MLQAPDYLVLKSARNSRHSALIDQMSASYAGIKWREEADVALKIEPYGLQDISYPEIFPLGQRCYACLYANYYTIINSNNKCEYVVRECPPLSRVCYLRIQKKENTITIASISVENKKSGMVFVELIWYCHESKRVMGRKKIQVPYVQKCTNPKFALFLIKTTISLPKKNNLERTETRTTLVIAVEEQIEYCHNLGRRKSVQLLLLDLEKAWKEGPNECFQEVIKLQNHENVLSIRQEGASIFVFTSWGIYETKIKVLDFALSRTQHSLSCFEALTEYNQILQKAIAFEMTLIKAPNYTRRSSEQQRIYNSQLNSAESLEDLQIKSCSMCANRVLLLASNNIIYEVDSGRIVNRQDLMESAKQSLCDNFEGESLNICEIHTIEGEKLESSILVAKVLCKNSEHTSVKFFTFKINERCIQFYSKVEGIEEHLINEGVTLSKEGSSHSVVSENLKSIGGYKLSIFYQMVIKPNQSSQPSENETRLLMIDICLINKLPTEDMIKENLKHRNPYIEGVFQVHCFGEGESESRSLLTHSREGLVVMSCEESQRSHAKIRTKCLKGFNFLDSRNVTAQNFSEPVFYKIATLFFIPTHFSIDPLALNIVASNKEKLQMFHLADQELIKGVEIFMKDTKAITYNESGEYIIVQSQTCISIISSVGFYVARKMQFRGEILSMRVCEDSILVHWEESISWRSLISVIRIKDCIETNFDAITLACSPSVSIIEANNSKLVLIQNNLIRVVELDSSACRQEKDWFSSNALQTESFKDVKRTKLPCMLTPDCPEAVREAHLAGAQKITCCKIVKGFLLVGTSWGEILAYHCYFSAPELTLKLIVKKVVTNSPICTLIMSHPDLQMFHVICASRAINTFVFFEPSKQRLTFDDFDPDIFEMKANHRILNEVVLRHKMMNQEIFNRYDAKIKQMELFLLKVKGDLEEVGVKLKPELKSEIIKMDQKIHTTIIESKLEESSINYCEKKKLEALQEAHVKQRVMIKVNKANQLTKEYEASISIQFQKQDQLRQRLDEVRKQTEKEKRELREQQLREFDEMSGSFNEKIGKMEKQISKLQCDTSMNVLLNVIENKMTDEELEMCKADLHQSLNLQLKQELEKEKEIRWQIWCQNQSIRLIKEKIQELEHLCINFYRGSIHLKNQLSNKNKRHSEFKNHISKADEEATRSLMKKEVENITATKRNIEGEIKRLAWRIEDLKLKNSEVTRIAQTYEEKVELMSEQLSSLKKDTDEKREELDRLTAKKDALRQKAKLKKEQSIRLRKKVDKIAVSEHPTEQSSPANKLRSYSVANNAAVQSKEIFQRQMCKRDGERTKEAIRNFHSNTQIRKVLDDNRELVNEVNVLRELQFRNEKLLKTLKDKISHLGGQVKLAELEKKTRHFSLNPRQMARERRSKTELFQEKIGLKDRRSAFLMKLKQCKRQLSESHNKSREKVFSSQNSRDSRESIWSRQNSENESKAKPISHLGGVKRASRLISMVNERKVLKL